MQYFESVIVYAITWIINKRESPAYFFFDSAKNRCPDYL